MPRPGLWEYESAADRAKRQRDEQAQQPPNNGGSFASKLGNNFASHLGESGGGGGGGGLLSSLGGGLANIGSGLADLGGKLRSDWNNLPSDAGTTLHAGLGAMSYPYEAGRAGANVLLGAGGLPLRQQDGTDAQGNPTFARRHPLDILTGWKNQLTQNPLDTLRNAAASGAETDQQLAQEGLFGKNPKIGKTPILATTERTLGDPLNALAGAGAASLGAGLTRAAATGLGFGFGTSIAQDKAADVPGWRDLSPDVQQALILGGSIVGGHYAPKALGALGKGFEKTMGPEGVVTNAVGKATSGGFGGSVVEDVSGGVIKDVASDVTWGKRATYNKHATIQAEGPPLPGAAEWDTQRMGLTREDNGTWTVVRKGRSSTSLVGPGSRIPDEHLATGLTLQQARTLAEESFVRGEAPPAAAAIEPSGIPGELPPTAPQGGDPSLAGALGNAMGESLAQLRSRITDIRYGPIEGNAETLLFNFDGVPHKAPLTDRRMVEHVFGMGSPLDERMAASLVLDKKAAPTLDSASQGGMDLGGETAAKRAALEGTPRDVPKGRLPTPLTTADKLPGESLADFGARRNGVRKAIEDSPAPYEVRPAPAQVDSEMEALMVREWKVNQAILDGKDARALTETPGQWADSTEFKPPTANAKWGRVGDRPLTEQEAAIINSVRDRAIPTGRYTPEQFPEAVRGYPIKTDAQLRALEENWSSGRRTQYEAMRNGETAVTPIPEPQIGGIDPNLQPTDATPIAPEAPVTQTVPPTDAAVSAPPPPAEAGAAPPPTPPPGAAAGGDYRDAGGNPRVVPERGSAGIDEALANKQAMNEGGLLQRTADRFPIGSRRRQMLGVFNPALNMPENVVNAYRGEGGVNSMLQTRFNTAMRPVLTDVQKAIADEPPTYIGVRGSAAQNAIIGSGADILERPITYQLSPTIRAAIDAYDKTQWDAVSAAARDGYNVDVLPYEQPGSAYVPHIPKVGSEDVKVAAAQKSVSSTNMTKGRAYETLWDRVGNDPSFVPETNLAELTAAHNKAIARNAANETFKAGTGGLTKVEVMDEVHPGLRDAKEQAQRGLAALKNRLDNAEQGQSTQIAAFKRQTTVLNNVADRMESFQAHIDSLGNEYGPELSHISGQMYELQLQKAALERYYQSTGQRVVLKGSDVDTLMSQIDQAQTKVTQLVKRYQAANTGDYVLDRNTFRYYPPETARAVAEVKRTPVGFMKGAIGLSDEIRAWHFAGDASPLTIQGQIAILADPLSAAKTAAEVLRDGNPKLALARIAAQDAANVEEYAFAMNRPFGIQSAELFQEHKGVARIPKLGALENNMFAIIERKSFELWKMQRDALLQDNPLMERNTANAGAARTTQQVIPQLDPTRRALSPLRAGVERGVLTSTSFATAPAMLIKDATSGFIKMGAAQTLDRAGTWSTLTGAEQLAMRRMLSISAVVMSISVASAAASAESRGLSVKDAMEEAINPNSRYFSALQLGGGKSVPIGGPLRSLIKAMAPKEASLDKDGLPFSGMLNFAMSKMNSMPAGTVALLRNQDFYGNKIRSGDFGHQILQTLWYTGEQVAPLGPGQVATDIRTGDFNLNHTGSQVASQFLGTNYSGPSPTEQLNQLARTMPDGAKDFNSLLASQQQKIKDGNPELWASKVSAGSDASRKYEQLKTSYRTEQQAADAQLLSGGMSREDWKAQYDDRRKQMFGAGRGLFGDQAITNPKTPEQRYIQIIEQNKDATGAIDWDAVDVGVAALTPQDQAYIQDRQGLGNTPIIQAYKQAAKLRSEMFALPKYAGFTADQARKIDDLWVEARANATRADAGPMLVALNKLATDGRPTIDPAILSGVRRRIVGTVVTLKQREAYAKAHPQMTLFFGGSGKAGPLTPEERASLPS